MLWGREILEAKRKPNNSLYYEICLTETWNYYSNSTEVFQKNKEWGMPEFIYSQVSNNAFKSMVNYITNSNSAHLVAKNTEKMVK